MHSRSSATAARISADAAGSVPGPCRNRQFLPSASAAEYPVTRSNPSLT
jgi:hypothetical protein